MALCGIDTAWTFQAMVRFTRITTESAKPCSRPVDRRNDYSIGLSIIEQAAWTETWPGKAATNDELVSHACESSLGLAAWQRDGNGQCG